MIVTVAGRRLLIHDREEWQLPSRPVTGPSPYPDLVHHAVIHWPGASSGWKPPRTLAETAAHLRWSHDLYLVGRGYSYGYGFVIGQTPINWNTDPVVTDIWEVRGFDIRVASNNGDIGIYDDYSNPGFNGRSISCQLTASDAFPATADQIMQARLWVALADQRYGERLTVIPHRTSDATGCPGNYIAARIGEIANRPTAAPPAPAPPPQEDEVTLQEIAAIADNVAGQIDKLDLVGQIINYPVPMPDGSTADLWTLIVDGRARTISLQAELDVLRADVAKLGESGDAAAVAELAAKVDRLVDVVNGPQS